MGKYMLGMIISILGIGIVEAATIGKTTEISRNWSIQKIGGAPTLLINGQKVSPLFYNQYFYSRPATQPFTRNNQEMMTSGNFLICTVPMSKDTTPWWLGPGEYDWSAMDKKVADILCVSPRARIIFYLQMDPPDWWLKAHPDEDIKYQQPIPKSQPRHATIWSLVGPSYASSVWFEDTAQMLIDLLTHVQDSSYGPNVLGVHMLAGYDGQWYHRADRKGINNRICSESDLDLNKIFVGDYSSHMLKHFQSFVRNKYKTNALLQKAWNDSRVTFETITIPGLKERLSIGPGQTPLRVFFDPKTERHLIDYNECFYGIQSEIILKFAHVVKKHFDNRFLVGVYGGQICWDYDDGRGFLGMVEARTLFDSPDLDYITTLGYSQRYLGFPGNFTNVNGSMALHGKLLIEELDHRTFLGRTPYEKKPIYGYVSTLPETVAMFRRDLCGVITRPVSAWYYDICNGLYHHPGIQAMFRQFHIIAGKSVVLGRVTRHEVAVVVDDRSYNYHPLKDCGLNRDVVNVQRTILGRMGASYDVFLVSDLPQIDLSQYKCFIFLNTFLLTPADRVYIKEKVCQNGRVICWTFAPGYLDGKSKSTHNITDITGFAVKNNRHDWAKYKSIRINESDNSLTDGIRGEVTCSVPVYNTTEYNPSPPHYYGREGFSINDPQAIYLGNFTDKSGCGLAMKEMNGWTSVYNCSTFWDARLLQNCLRLASVHVYSSDTNDSIYASEQFVGIHTSIAGQKTIKLKQKSDVYDVFADKDIGRQVNSIVIDLPARETALFFLGSKKTWESLPFKQTVDLPVN